MSQILFGGVVADQIVDQLRIKLAKFNHSTSAQFAIILVGENPASISYVNRKQQLAAKLGIGCHIFHLANNIQQSAIIKLINQLNAEINIDGIICQLPLPAHLDAFPILSTISAAKDIDCLNPYNIGLLSMNEKLTNLNFLPCTPAGIIELFKYYQINLQGKIVLIIGRSNIVSKPLGMMLLKKEHNSTIIQAHSATKDLNYLMSFADIIVVAIGEAKFISKQNLKAECIIVDVGINRLDGKIVGDVDFNEVSQRVAAITPVPGGVGLLTVAMLMHNVVNSFCQH